MQAVILISETRAETLQMFKRWPLWPLESLKTRISFLEFPVSIFASISNCVQRLAFPLPSSGFGPGGLDSQVKR